MNQLSYRSLGPVPDFAINNGTIALFAAYYWDTLFTGSVQFLNAGTLYPLADDMSPPCLTNELTTDHDAFYLACNGAIFQIAQNGTHVDFVTLTGDARELRDNYLYDGWVYIPDGTKVKLSTNNNVP